MTKSIGILVGSLRKKSYSRALANNLVNLFPEGYSASIIEIGDLPLYNQDYDDDGNVPERNNKFRDTLSKLDGIIFVTPEYNRSVPAVLKNAIDVGSRPFGQSVWDNKPAAIISNSPGSIGGFGANHHLRQSLTFLNMPIMQQPEAYISKVNTLLDDDGKINNDGTMKYLQSIVDSYVELLNRY